MNYSPKDCNECLNRAKLMFSHYRRNAEEEGKYTTLVFSLGYVTMMTIYSTMHHYLTFQRKAVFICFLFVLIVFKCSSILLFSLFISSFFSLN